MSAVHRMSSCTCLVRSCRNNVVLSLLSAVVVGLALVALSGCSSFPSSFSCSSNVQCTRGNSVGSCVSGGCAFPDSTCGTGLRFDDSAEGPMSGSCVLGGVPDASGNGDGGPNDAVSEGPASRNLCGGSTDLPARPGDACGLCLMGTFACDGTETLRCENEPSIELDITDMGEVSASTTFSSRYPARLSIDGSLQTSWFSAGSQAEATGRSTYIWDIAQDECIVGVSITGNERNSNSSFREDFGFEQVTVQVLDADDNVVSSQAGNLNGTPDPPVDVAPNVTGRAVQLEFNGHESSDCGGFSELIVTVARRP
ncbi:MAG: hypothetical protein AAGF12_11105 [Myxococcota bacterium]